MISTDELLEIAKRRGGIRPEEIGLPSWRSDCDGFQYELSNLFCRSGIAYHHKDGYRWSNGDFLTKRQCRIYHFEPGVMNR